jgi:hypothetical protein
MNKYLLYMIDAFTFLVRDQRLGANVESAQGPTGLDKYLICSLTGEVIPHGMIENLNAIFIIMR